MRKTNPFTVAAERTPPRLTVFSKDGAKATVEPVAVDAKTGTVEVSADQAERIAAFNADNT